MRLIASCFRTLAGQVLQWLPIFREENRKILTEGAIVKNMKPSKVFHQCLSLFHLLTLTHHFIYTKTFQSRERDYQKLCLRANNSHLLQI